MVQTPLQKALAGIQREASKNDLQSVALNVVEALELISGDLDVYEKHFAGLKAQMDGLKQQFQGVQTQMEDMAHEIREIKKKIGLR